MPPNLLVIFHDLIRENLRTTVVAVARCHRGQGAGGGLIAPPTVKYNFGCRALSVVI